MSNKNINYNDDDSDDDIDITFTGSLDSYYIIKKCNNEIKKYPKSDSTPSSTIFIPFNIKNNKDILDEGVGLINNKDVLNDSALIKNKKNKVDNHDKEIENYKEKCNDKYKNKNINVIDTDTDTESETIFQMDDIVTIKK